MKYLLPIRVFFDSQVEPEDMATVRAALDEFNQTQPQKRLIRFLEKGSGVINQYFSVDKLIAEAERAPSGQIDALQSSGQ